MKYPSIILAGLCALTLSPAAAAQSAQLDSHRANAALTYWQAFALMPALSADQEQLLQEWDQAPLDDQAEELVAAARPSLMYLRRGARLAHCDWGLDYNDGISLLMPHLAQARTLTRLAALEARFQLKSGDLKAAQENSTAMLVLARHVASDSILVAILVRYAIESITVKLVASYLPQQQLSHAEATAAFQSLPDAARVAQAVPTEKKFMAEWMIEQLKEANETSWRKLWTGIMGTPAVPETLKRVASREQAIVMIEDLLPMYDQLADVVSLPPADFDREYASFMRRAAAASAAAELFLPNMKKILAAERRNEAWMAMLLAAFAIVESGPSKLQDIQDPFGDGPFEYRALEGGFELKSKLLYEGQPVTIVIGSQPKE